jgi:hypothetical protein
MSRVRLPHSFLEFWAAADTNTSSAVKARAKEGMRLIAMAANETTTEPSCEIGEAVVLSSEVGSSEVGATACGETHDEIVSMMN